MRGIRIRLLGGEPGESPPDRSKLSEGEPNTNLYFKFPRTDADLIEEAADIKAYNEALMEDDATRYSMDDVMHMAMEAE